MEQDLACGLEELLSRNAFMALLGESSAVHKVRVQFRVGDVLRVQGPRSQGPRSQIRVLAARRPNKFCWQDFLVFLARGILELKDTQGRAAFEL